MPNHRGINVFSPPPPDGYIVGRRVADDRLWAAQGCMGWMRRHRVEPQSNTNVYGKTRQPCKHFSILIHAVKYGEVGGFFVTEKWTSRVDEKKWESYLKYVYPRSRKLKGASPESTFCRLDLFLPPPGIQSPDFNCDILRSGIEIFSLSALRGCFPFPKVGKCKENHPSVFQSTVTDVCRRRQVFFLVHAPTTLQILQRKHCHSVAAFKKQETIVARALNELFSVKVESSSSLSLSLSLSFSFSFSFSLSLSLSLPFPHPKPPPSSSHLVHVRHAQDVYRAVRLP
jgi:hypothetical protein